MTTQNPSPNGLVLTGIDGSNPLGFLAALGILITVEDRSPGVRLQWMHHAQKWCPVVTGIDDADDLLDQLADTLHDMSVEPFLVHKRMPFSAVEFEEIARSCRAMRTNRRMADLLASYGCTHIRDEDLFHDTMFRMVRSGDSAGQGFLHYAVSIRQQTDRDSLERTLFREWSYQDECFSLRLDPIEDSNYALRWDDPSKANKSTMIGANSLALEGLRALPTVPNKGSLLTTGFSRHDRQVFFTWPIWRSALGVDVVKSLLSLNALHNPEISRFELNEFGIEEVFRSRRFAPNQYYKNFSPSWAC